MELKHCPFCGGAAVINQTKCEIIAASPDSVAFNFSIRCSKCGATAPLANGRIAVCLFATGSLNVWHNDMPNAIEAWNRRAK